MPCTTLPILPDTTHANRIYPSASASADPIKNTRLMVACEVSSYPGIFCKPESPLLPRRPLSFWNSHSDSASVIACVRIDR